VLRGLAGVMRFRPSRLVAIAAMVVGVLELYGGVASASPATFTVGALTLLFGAVAVTDRVPYRFGWCIGLILAAAALIAIGGLLFGAFGGPGPALTYTAAYLLVGGFWGWLDDAER